MKKTKTKILFIDFTSFYGGGQKFILTASKLLNNQFDFFYTISSEKLFLELNTKNSILISNKIFYSIESIRIINKFIIKNNIEFVILNGNRPIYFSFLITNKAIKIAYKHTSNNAYINNVSKFFGPIFLNFNYLFCSKIVLLYQNSIKEVYFNKYKVKVIPNPIENEVFCQKNTSTLNSTIKLLTISRLDPNKGIYWLLNAYKILKNSSLLKFELIIAGDGPESEKLSKYIQDNKIKDVNLIGFIEDVTVLLESADIFILPSKFESLPLSIIEALSFGLPIIATNTGGINELVLNNKNGFLVNYNDTKNLINSIKLLLNDEKLRQQFSIESSHNYMNNFSNRSFMENFKKLILT